MIPCGYQRYIYQHYINTVSRQCLKVVTNLRFPCVQGQMAGGQTVVTTDAEELQT